MNSPADPRLALVLMGGGARTAYQVGVLSAIASWLPRQMPLPFPIVCGTSAGAINAATLASHASQFRVGVGRLASVWSRFTTRQVLRADEGIASRGRWRWIAAFAWGGLGRHNPVSLLDPSPLHDLLEQRLAVGNISRGIAAGYLRALSITAFDYANARTVSFFEGAPDLLSWDRARRAGRAVRLTVDHLLASASIPFLFPAVLIDGSPYGDGSMRQSAPLSPAIHLGAERILVVHAGTDEPRVPHANGHYPSFAQIGGHVLDSIFLDNVEVDLERLRRANEAIARMPGPLRAGYGLRRIEACVISPSESLASLAYAHYKQLPHGLRRLLAGLGALNEEGSGLVSYLLFEKEYCRALMALGRRDAARQRDEILALLAGPSSLSEGLEA